MFKSDFLLKQLEDLAKLIARMASLRKELELEKAEKLLQEAYSSLNLEETKVLGMDLTQEMGDDPKTAFFRLELIADLLVESYYMHGNSVLYLEKAKSLLNFIQENSSTFSIEIIQKLEEIERQLNN